MLYNPPIHLSCSVKARVGLRDHWARPLASPRALPTCYQTKENNSSKRRAKATALVDPRKSGETVWAGIEGVLRKPRSLGMWSARAGAAVATSNATAAAMHIILPAGRVRFRDVMLFFIVVSFFVGAVRRFFV